MLHELVIVLLIGHSLAEPETTIKKETNVPFLAGMIVLLLVLLIIFVILLILLCYRRKSRLGEKRTIALSRVNYRSENRPKTSPAVVEVNHKKDVEEGDISDADGARRLAMYASMDDRILNKAISMANKKHIETKTKNDEELLEGQELSTSDGQESDASLPCDILTIERPSGDEGQPREAELDLDDGRCSVIMSNRCDPDRRSISGWTTSGEITPMDLPKEFRLPPPPLTTPPKTPECRRHEISYESREETEMEVDRSMHPSLRRMRCAQLPPSHRQHTVTASVSQLPPLAPASTHHDTRVGGGSLDVTFSPDKIPDLSLDPAWAQERNVDLSLDLDAINTPDEDNTDDKQKLDSKSTKERKHRNKRKKKKDYGTDDNIKNLVTNYKRSHLKSLDGESVDNLIV